MAGGSPTQPVKRSRAGPGVIASEPDDVTAVTTRDEHDQPIGVLEHWGGGAWIYADVAALEPLESSS